MFAIKFQRKKKLFCFDPTLDVTRNNFGIKWSDLLDQGLNTRHSSAYPHGRMEMDCSLCGLLPGEGLGRGETTGDTAGGVFSAQGTQSRTVFHSQSHPLAIIEELVTWISEKLKTTPF